MDSNLRKDLHRLARNKCANYNERNGTCWLNDRKCAAARCSYFKSSVLPERPDLEHRYRAYQSEAEPDMAFCQSCGNRYSKGSNAAKYCDNCRSKIAAAKKRERDAKYREAKRRNRGA